MKKHLTKLFAVFLMTFVAILMIGTTAQAKWIVNGSSGDDVYGEAPDMSSIPPNYYLSEYYSLYFYTERIQDGAYVYTIYQPNGEYETSYHGIDTATPQIIIVDNRNGCRICKYTFGMYQNREDFYAIDDFNNQSVPISAEKHYVAVEVIAYDHPSGWVPTLGEGPELIDDPAWQQVAGGFKTYHYVGYYTVNPPTEPYRLLANDGDPNQNNSVWHYPDGTIMRNCLRDYYDWCSDDYGKTFWKQYLNENGRGNAEYRGWTLVDGGWYYAEEGGYIDTEPGWFYEDHISIIDRGPYWDAEDPTPAWYYLDENNSRTDNQWVKKDGAWRYVGSNGRMVTNAWVDGYYLQDDGTIATNKWIGDKYVGEDGKVVDNPTQTGWVKKNGYWYYYKDGKYVKNTMIDGYYLGSDGKLVANTWAKINNRWYYFGSDGKKLTNSWVKSGGAWYYLGSDGAMLTNSWVKYNSKWYYMGSNGTLQTNAWVKTNGKYYHVGSDGAAQANAWVKTNGKWYYLNGNGNPVTNTRIYYNGKYYRFNSAGVCIG